MKLRKYQKKDFKKLNKRLKKLDHVLFGASTGYGKSAIIYNAVKKEVDRGGCVLVIAPRRKLVKQLSEALQDFNPSIVMGSDTNMDENSCVYVASTSTLHNRLKKFGRKYLGKIGMVLIDEVHINFKSTSMSYVEKFYWDTAKWIGLSATPIDECGYRLEGWDYTIYNHQAQDLIDKGWLAPVMVMVEDVPKGLGSIGTVGGDYNEGQLATFMSEDARVNNIYEVWSKYAKDRKVMIFAVNIAHATIIHDDFEKHGVNVGIIHSQMGDDEIEDVLENFSAGFLDILVNVSMLTTGFDETSVDCLIIARPTKSKRLFIQIIGRGLRLHKGKKDCLILDIAGTIKEHGYPTMRRDFNRVRPKRGESEPLEFSDVTCPYCDYSAQARNCRREVITTKLYITKRRYCPNCDEIISETVEDTKTIERLRLVSDYTNVSKVSDATVGEFVTDLCAHKGYNTAWVKYVAKAYNSNKKFKHFMKLLYNKYNAEMLNKDTAVNNIAKKKSELGIT